MPIHKMKRLIEKVFSGFFPTPVTLKTIQRALGQGALTLEDLEQAWFDHACSIASALAEEIEDEEDENEAA